MWLTTITMSTMLLWWCPWDIVIVCTYASVCMRMFEHVFCLVFLHMCMTLNPRLNLSNDSDQNNTSLYEIFLQIQTSACIQEYKHTRTHVHEIHLIGKRTVTIKFLICIPFNSDGKICKFKYWHTQNNWFFFYCDGNWSI